MDLAPNPTDFKKYICKCCCDTINEQDQFCQHCGFPLQETDELQQRFINNRGYNKEQLKKLESKIEYAAIIFYILAGLLFLAGLLIFFFNTQNNLGVIFLVTNGILAILFFCLGAMSDKYPLASIICGLTLYLISIVTGLSSGIIINLLVLVALTTALINAFKAQSIRKQHNL